MSEIETSASGGGEAIESAEAFLDELAVKEPYYKGRKRVLVAMIEQRDNAIRARAIEECVVGAEEKTERMLDSATEHREKGMAQIAERIEYAAGYVADLSIELRALLATDGEPLPITQIRGPDGEIIETGWITTGEPAPSGHPEPDGGRS